jgi:glutamate 5-kinase
MKTIRHDIMAKVKKVIVKIGSAVLTGKDGLDLNVIGQLVDGVAELTKKGCQVVIVTSGAIASGKHRMGITGALKSMPQKQAAAAIGQGRLMRLYSTAFGKHGMYVAQILLTMSDLTDRKRFLNIRNTLSTLMEWGVIAIINENDTVAIDEIKFGDNDNLAAMIAPLIDAHLVINLTSTEGLYTCNPSCSDDARLIPLVKDITEEIETAATDDTTTVGLGGMKSKVLAARKVTAYGIPYVIALGKKKRVIQDIMAGKERGTLFLPAAKPLNSRKYWIAFTLKSRGKLFLDEGAKKAIVETGKSLLPSGIINIEGNFEIGDPVTCTDTEGKPFATGLVNYCAADVRKIMGVQTSGIESLLGHKDYDEIIHRDNLAVTKQPGKRK